MEIQDIKADIFNRVSQTEDLEILEAIKVMLANHQGEDDFWESLPEYQKQSIDKGLQQAGNGETISHEEVLKKYEKWLTK